MYSALFLQAAGLLAIVGTVSGHGVLTSPPVRAAGAGYTTACGDALTKAETQDPTAPIENLASAMLPAKAATCNPFLCKGLQFSDNAANVQKYAAGETIKMTASLPIPHEGPANVSIVDTATNTVIGLPLIEFATYADEKVNPLPANNTAFEVKMPDLKGKCAVAGECVMQWFWFGQGAKQTYESCVDMVIGTGAAAVGGAKTNATKTVAEKPACK